MPANEQQSQAQEQGAQQHGGQMSQNPEVIRQVQQQLSSQGYDTGPVDGILGPKTQSSLRKFQQDRQLQASGRLDAQTLAELGVSPAETFAQQPSEQGSS